MSFHYIQSIRDQIVASMGITDIPIIVASNKSDLAKNKIDSNELAREQSRSKHEIVSTVHKTWRSSHRDNAAIEEDQQKCCAIWN
jgi:50S ribosomal subunit-associated GTPase HflX